MREPCRVGVAAAVLTHVHLCLGAALRTPPPPTTSSPQRTRLVNEYPRTSCSDADVSRRTLLHGAAWAGAGAYSSGSIPSASAWTVDPVKPDERDTYLEAQKGDGSLILWVGAGSMTGVYKNVFQAGSTVVALDLVQPDSMEVSAATTYASEHGYELRFEQGDATKLRFSDASFDVVVSSMFLCQGSETNHPLPNWSEVVVSEIRRVLKPGGRFGFYEHVEDVDQVIVGKVFGERGVIRVQHVEAKKPGRTNVMAGVVRKV